MSARKGGRGLPPSDEQLRVPQFARQSPLRLCEAALVALAFNVMMVVVAIVSIVLTVPAGLKQSG